MILGLNLAFFGDQPQKVNFSRHFEAGELLVLLRLVPTMEILEPLGKWLELLFWIWTPLLVFSLAPGDKDVEEEERRLLGVPCLGGVCGGLFRASMIEAVVADVEIMDSTSISWFVSPHFNFT